MSLSIEKPIGSKLNSKDLPGESQVQVQVVKGLDGMPDLRLTSSIGRPYAELSISDLKFLCEWAGEE